MNILIFIFCIAYFILAIRRLDWAVMFLIVALPSYLIRFSILGIPFTVLEIMILISFAVWFARFTKFNLFLKGKYGWKDLKKNREKRSKYPFRIEIILLLIVSYAAVVMSGFSSSALGTWKAYFFEPLLFFILILNLFKGRGGIKKIIWSLAVSAFLVSIIAIYQKFTGAWIFNEFWAVAETRRVTSFFGYPNAVGLFLGPIILILIGYLFNQIKNKKEKVAIIIVILSSLLSIYFAKSEGALIGIVAGIVVFGLLSKKKIRWMTVSLVIIVSGIMLFSPARDYTINKFLLRDLSGQIRKAQWAETWDMLKDGKFIMGSGISNYQNAIKPYHKEGIFVRDYNDPDWHRKTVFNEEYRNKVWQPTEVYLYPHNIFLNFWVEIGIIGMILFAWIIGRYFIVGLKNINLDNKYLTLGLVGSMTVIIVHGIVDVPYFKNDLAIIFWLMVAMMSLINLKLKNE